MSSSSPLTPFHRYSISSDGSVESDGTSVPAPKQRKASRSILKEKMKRVKRSGSSFIMNVPVLGVGAPSPKVIEKLPQRTKRKKNMSVALLGDTLVGKTSLMERYIQKVFYEENAPTISPTFYARNIHEMLDETPMEIRLQIWDTPGDPVMRPLLTSWCTNVDVAFILYSLEDQTRQSYETAISLLELLLQNSKQSELITFLIGSKLDELEGSNNIKRTIPKEEIEALCTERSLHYHEISSRNNIGVESLFTSIVAVVQENIKEKERSPAPSWKPDSKGNRCFYCNCSWSVTNRRHHCRNCGEIFCGRCAHHFIPIPRIGKLTPTRVCTPCFDDIMASY